MAVIQTGAVAADLNDWAEVRSYESRTVYPERGKIYDRWGHLLAGNKVVYELGIELQYVQNPQAIALTLTSLYKDLDYNEVYNAASKKFNPDSAIYAPLNFYVSEDIIEKIKFVKAEYEKANPGGENPNLPSLRGVVWSPHLIRTYPEQNLASNVLGFYSFRNTGKESGHYGIEERYNDLLTGRPTLVNIPMDPYMIKELPNIPPGADVILTIDREMQAAVERILDKALEKNGSRSGTILVMNPENGEILVMATTPRINPNQYWNFGNTFDNGNTFNNAVSATYEPGSVFKVLTMAAALDAGAVNPETTFVDSGTINVGGINITNWDLGAWGLQDMTGCLRHSLNVCLSWVATELGPTKFYQYMDAFGIGHRTNVDLAGEEAFPLTVPGDTNWYMVNLATNSFGQGVSATPIQMITSISAVANDGKMMAPHIVRAYVQDGHQFDISPMLVGTPIKAETAKTLTKMLVNSLEEESSVALVDGYTVAGKTGTGSIAENGYYLPNATNASFVGWGPADDPKIVVYIWFERPQADIWGSTIAAPVFSEVFSELMKIADIPPDAIRNKLTNK